MTIDTAAAAPESPAVEVSGAARARRRRILQVAAVGAWVAIVAGGRVWGVALHDAGRNIVLFTPPVLGGYRPGPPGALWVPAALAVVGVAAGPRLAGNLPWRRLLAGATVAAGAWWIALAAVDGASGLTQGLEWEREWAPGVAAAAADPLGYLRSYVDDLPGASVQVRGHPPGFVLAGALLARLGLPLPGALAALVIGAGMTIVPAVAATVRRLAGEDAARRVVPFLVLTPAATWLVASPDALIAAVVAWTVHLLVVALVVRGRRADGGAAAAGVLASVAVLLSYGMVLAAFIPAFVARVRRRARPLVVATAVAVTLTAGLALAGYWWFAGLAATRHEYDTLGLDRPYGFFLVSNLSAWALVLGPAGAAALAGLRDRRLWALAGGGVAAALVANLSGLSEGEVERIWLPFSMWVLAATAALGPGPQTGQRAMRAWLAAQAGSALALNLVIRPHW